MINNIPSLLAITGFIVICIIGCSSDNPIESDIGLIEGIWEGVSTGAKQGPTVDSVIILEENIHFEFGDSTFAYAVMSSDLAKFGPDGTGGYQIDDSTITFAWFISRSIQAPLAIFDEFSYLIIEDTLILTKPISDLINKLAYNIKLVRTNDMKSSFVTLPPEPELDIGWGWLGVDKYVSIINGQQIDSTESVISFGFNNGIFAYYFGDMFGGESWRPGPMSGAGDYRICADTMYLLPVDIYEIVENRLPPEGRYIFNLDDTLLTLTKIDFDQFTISQHYILKVDCRFRPG